MTFVDDAAEVDNDGIEVAARAASNHRLPVASRPRESKVWREVGLLSRRQDSMRRAPEVRVTSLGLVRSARKLLGS